MKQCSILYDSDAFISGSVFVMGIAHLEIRKLISTIVKHQSAQYYVSEDAFNKKKFKL